MAVIIRNDLIIKEAIMYRNIFISHSSHNAWLIDGLLSLIRAVNPYAETFCSSEAVIPPGGNYKEYIYSKLTEADMFIAVVSDEYWKSKYAIMELGGAYQRYCFDSDSVSIQPVLVPPLDKGSALANTPLVELQLTDLTKPEAIKLLLSKITDGEDNDRIKNLDIMISEYVATVKKTVLQNTSLTKDIAYGAYYQEPANNPVPKEKIVRCQKLEEGRFLMDFHLSRLDYLPSFASVALEYWDEINFQEYLHFDRDAAFDCCIDNTDGALKYINIEFKYGEDHKVYQTITEELGPGINEISIPLRPMDHKPLREITQICFVIIPADMVRLDGEFIIDNIGVSFKEKNILQ